MKLDKDEIRLLDGIELGVFNTKCGLRKDLHPVWDRLVDKHMIEEVSYFVLTSDGDQALDEAHTAAALGEEAP